MSLVIGIDPGLSGAIAFYDAAAKTLLSVHDMPLQSANSPSAKRAIDPYSLSILIDGHAKSTALAVVEEVSGGVYTNARGERRGQGSAASFNFGKAAGLVHGILATCMIPMAMVKPAVWKLLMGLDRDKTHSREMAATFFPQFRELFARKKDDGRAEAALLAYFGSVRLLGGQG